jgi:acyl-CoA dehydrogenase
MLSFELTEDQQLIVGTVSDFAKESVGPRAREHEKSGLVSKEVRTAIHEMGLGLASLPEAVGGQGLGLLTAALINEELAYGDAAVLFGLPAFGAFPLAVMELGSEAQQKELLGPLSDPASAEVFGAVAYTEKKPNRERAGMIATAKATKNGFELTGSKCFVSNAAHADTFIVFAQVDDAAGWNGLGAFVVKKDNPGLRVSAKQKTLGLDCASFGEVVLESAQVPTADRLLGKGDFSRDVIRFFAKYSLMVAARAVGLARNAFDISREYCDIRKAFGKPIGHFQAVAFALADRHMDNESARDLVRRAAWAWDTNREEATCLLYSARAIACSHEAAMKAGDVAVQLHGGAGFMRDVIVEKLMRDAKQIALAGLTAEQADQMAAAVDLGLPLDPALLLPTAETQSVST